jgi:hypothetical protein
VEKENVQIGQVGVSRIQSGAEPGSSGPAKTEVSSGVLDMLSFLAAWLQPQSRELAEASQVRVGADVAGAADLSKPVTLGQQEEGNQIRRSSLEKETQAEKKKDKAKDVVMDMDKAGPSPTAEAKQGASASASGPSADILNTAAASMLAPSSISAGVPERKESGSETSGLLPPLGRSAQPVSGQQMQPGLLRATAEQQSQAPPTGEPLAATNDAAAAMQATTPQASVEVTKEAQGLRPPERPPLVSTAGAEGSTANRSVQAPTMRETAAQQPGLKSKNAEKMSHVSLGIAPAGSSGVIGHEVAEQQPVPGSESAPAAASLLHAAVSQDAPDRSARQPLQSNPFQRMDSVTLPQTTWLRTSLHHLAVGVRDPALGWVEVQTQSSSGHLSASLATNSVSSHAALVAEAPALTQFLMERNVPIETVSVAMQGGDAGSGQQHAGGENRNQQDFPQGQGAIGFSPPEAEGSEERNQLENGWSRLSVRA